MPVQIHAPIPLLTAAVIGALAIALLFRRPLPGMTRALLTGAIALLAAAAGEIHATLPRGGDVVVMVDLSPSTRGAMYRDRAFLNLRLKHLLGSRPYRLVVFAQDQSPAPANAKLDELPAAFTRFDPPEADAVLLFSDGQFEQPPWAPPTFPVIDPALLEPNDAALTDARAAEDSVDVTVSNRGLLPSVAVIETAGVRREIVESKGTTHLRLTPKPMPAIGQITVDRVVDLWPENNRLSFAVAEPPERQRWWIGSAPPTDWTLVGPGDLTPEDFLQPSVIALHNVTAADLPPGTQDRLQQYVRDLGGSLLILGGDRAFAAGGYSGTTLDALSPLASDPPTPARHWLLLTDASGSMATGSRWTSASTALAAVVRELPAADLVSVGSFAADLHWWINNTPVQEARSKTLPPPGIAPSGPTNLQPVLQKLIDAAPADLEKELLLLTDGETSLEAEALVPLMRRKRIRLHVLAIGNGPALAALQKLSTATGGSYTVELNAADWLAGVRKLLQAARSEGVVRRTTAIDYTSLLRLPSRTVPWFNRTWLKPSATAIAISTETPMAAVWPVGSGQVAAAVFELQPGEIEAMAAHIARPPRDPRFRVDWHARDGRVIVDAVEGDRPLNGLKLDIKFRGFQGGGREIALTQIAPGRYEAALPTSPQPQIAVVRHDGREVDRRTLPGRYAREFAAIGVDEANLRKLAERSGGRVVAPHESGQPLPRLWRDTDLTAWLASLAAVLVGAGLIHWKRS